MVWLLFCALVPGGRCARRMPPPSPDRFAPRLELVRTRGRAGVELFFDEAVDLDRVPVDSFRIVGPDSASLALRGLTLGRGGDRLLAWTALQQPVVYRLEAMVPDLSGNVARVRSRFRGGAQPDTVPPRVTSVRPGPGQTRYAGDEFRFEFSKPMDTLVPPRVITIPPALETLLLPSWDPGWERLTLRRPGVRAGTDPSPAPELPGGRPLRPGTELPEPVPDEDTVPVEDTRPKPTGYVVLLPGLSDLEGNRTARYSAISFTGDTVFAGALIPGRVTGPAPALVFLLADTAAALAVTDDSGRFALRVPEGRYEAVAVSDTNRDGRADFAGRVPFSVPGPESLLVELRLEPEPRAVGEYRR